MIVLARIAQKDDLYNMIHHGPGKEALDGPVLTECHYPEVLVAKARSHTGKDLELVLYNGKEPGNQLISLEKLQPNKNYLIQESGKTFTADEEGRVQLEVELNGRTKLTIQEA